MSFILHDVMIFSSKEGSFTCPRNEGSVKLSVYPTIPVENTTSPLTGFSAPNEIPSKTLPSSRVIFALTILSLLSEPLTVLTRRTAVATLESKGFRARVDRTTFNRRSKPALDNRPLIFNINKQMKRLLMVHQGRKEIKSRSHLEFSHSAVTQDVKTHNINTDDDCDLVLTYQLRI